MKKITSITGACKKLFILFLCMLAGVSSRADNVYPVSGRRLLWEYDGILPFIAYAMFGIIVISVAYVSIRSWIDNRHDQGSIR